MLYPCVARGPLAAAPGRLPKPNNAADAEDPLTPQPVPLIGQIDLEPHAPAPRRLFFWDLPGSFDVTLLAAS